MQSLGMALCRKLNSFLPTTDDRKVIAKMTGVGSGCLQVLSSMIDSGGYRHVEEGLAQLTSKTTLTDQMDCILCHIHSSAPLRDD
jgi:hypothetical protein